jgi:hypothetical protein
MIGIELPAYIYKLDDDNKPVQIVLSSENITLPSLVLEKGVPYQAIVLHKYKFGLLVDIGIEWHWKYGSKTSLIHISNYSNSKYESFKIGDIVTTYYHGELIKNNRPILGNEDFDPFWINGKSENYINSHQILHIRTKESGKHSYWLNNKYPCTLHIEKNNELYNKKELVASLSLLKDGDTLEVIVNRISTKKRFVVELTEDSISLLSNNP